MQKAIQTKLSAVFASVTAGLKAGEGEVKALIAVGKALPPVDKTSTEMKEVREALAIGYEKALGKSDKARVSAAALVVLAAAHGIIAEGRGVALAAQSVRELGESFGGYEPPKAGDKRGANVQKGKKASDKAGKAPSTPDGYAVPTTPAMRVAAFLALADALGVTLTKAQQSKLQAA